MRLRLSRVLRPMVLVRYDTLFHSISFLDMQACNMHHISIYPSHFSFFFFLNFLLTYLVGDTQSRAASALRHGLADGVGPVGNRHVDSLAHCALFRGGRRSVWAEVRYAHTHFLTHTQSHTQNKKHTRTHTHASTHIHMWDLLLEIATLILSLLVLYSAVGVEVFGKRYLMHIHARTRMHTHKRKHTRTHTRKHTRTHIRKPHARTLAHTQAHTQTRGTDWKSATLILSLIALYLVERRSV